MRIDNKVFIYVDIHNLQLIKYPYLCVCILKSYSKLFSQFESSEYQVSAWF